MSKSLEEALVNLQTADVGQPPKDSEDQSNGTSTSSTNSAGEHVPENAVYPQNSVLELMMKFGRDQSEAADCYLIGAFIGVVAACAARRVFFPWGCKRWYPNLYIMLVGLPGDRKSDTLQIARQFLSDILPQDRFLPSLISKEALFDAYDKNEGGNPDKVMLVPDGNILLENWKSGYGEQTASYFLDLYDCEPLTEQFKRNKSENSPSGKRTTDETSTTVIIGTTFSACRFPSHTIQSGMHRRFLFSVGEKRGRTIITPNAPDEKLLNQIQQALTRIANLDETSCSLGDSASQIWEEYQYKNRNLLDGTSDEQERSRLNSAPNHVMKIAMLFSLSSWSGKGYSKWTGVIDAESLLLAIDFIDHAGKSATLLNTIAHRKETGSQAESILAAIQQEFAHCTTEDGWIRLSKSQLTKRFCPNSSRPGSLKTTDLYQRIIPWLIQNNMAKQYPKDGRREDYGFLPEDA